jgi:hypothetical protein
VAALVTGDDGQTVLRVSKDRLESERVRLGLDVTGDGEVPEGLRAETEVAARSPAN